MELSRTKKLEKIVYLNTLMNQTNDFNELLNIILRETEKLFDVEGTSILLEDKETGKLFFYISTGEKKDVLNTIQMCRGEGVCGYVFDTGKILVENHPETSTMFSNKVDKQSKFITKNLLCVPLKINENIIGVIELVNKKNRDFTQGDVEFLDAIAIQISLTLERARMVEEMIKSERLASIGETVAGLAHCIKNILNGLRGGAFIVNKSIKKIESEKLELGWEMVQININKISALALDMLHYSKERIPQVESTDLNKLLEEVIELMRQNAEEHNISIEKTLQPGLGNIEIEAKGIYRCVLNLVSNAIDALECREKGIVMVSSKREKDFVRIEIEDNGCGVDEELQKKLFTKFFSTKGSKGTGLGLPVTQKIIHEHKGTISVSSKKDVGTKFVINLPT